MQTLQVTYRTLAAFLLLTFTMGVLAPAGISAVGLLCDMGPEAMMAPAHACCDDHAMTGSEGHAAAHMESTGDPACDMDINCVSYVDKAVDEAPAVQQSNGKVPAALLSGEIRFETETDPVPALLRSADPVRIHAPPLFLLNASFLN